MKEAPDRPNIELRIARNGEPHVVFAFPYRADRVDAVRAIPGRRFDWESREWWVPQSDTAAIYVADVLARWPELTASADARGWLESAPSGWLARVATLKQAGEGRFMVRTLAGPLPEELARHEIRPHPPGR